LLTIKEAAMMPHTSMALKGKAKRREGEKSGKRERVKREEFAVIRSDQ
jgi:hypothetical protein